MSGGLLESVVENWLGANLCVAAHEVRQRLRGWRAFGLLGLFTGLPTGLLLLILWNIVDESQSGGRVEPQAGLILFSVLIGTLLGLALVTVPAYAAGSVAMEKEKRTLEIPGSAGRG